MAIQGFLIYIHITAIDLQGTGINTPRCHEFIVVILYNSWFFRVHLFLSVFNISSVLTLFENKGTPWSQFYSCLARWRLRFSITGNRSLLIIEITWSEEVLCNLCCIFFLQLYRDPTYLNVICLCLRKGFIKSTLLYSSLDLNHFEFVIFDSCHGWN